MVEEGTIRTKSKNEQLMSTRVNTFFGTVAKYQLENV